MGMLLAFVSSLVLSFFLCRKSYRKQLLSQPTKKVKAAFVSAVLGIAVFIVVNVGAAVALIPDLDKTTTASTAFDGATVETFTRLYNDNVDGIATSKKRDLSAIKIKSEKRNVNTVDLVINANFNGRVEVDKQGKIASVLWRSSNAKPDALLSMAVAVEVLDSTAEREEILNFLNSAVKAGVPKSDFKTKRGEYYLSRKNDGQLSLLITPLY
ncbi:hypothetical protein FHR25_004719 [Yokenella regensburgei]|nr:hypothetical protein FHR25_004719 [Yokenella regensburgei]